MSSNCRGNTAFFFLAATVAAKRTADGSVGTDLASIALQVSPRARRVIELTEPATFFDQAFTAIGRRELDAVEQGGVAEVLRASAPAAIGAAGAAARSAVGCKLASLAVRILSAHEDDQQSKNEALHRVYASVGLLGTSSYDFNELHHPLLLTLFFNSTYFFLPL